MISFLATMLTVAILSTFLNDTPVVAAMLPLLVAVSLQAKMPASGFLMPIGLATILGGMATTIGTSTNLLVTSVAADLAMREFQMFSFSGPVRSSSSAESPYSISGWLRRSCEGSSLEYRSLDASYLSAAYGVVPSPDS